MIEEELALLRAQQEYAQEQIAGRWSHLSGRMNEMGRMLTGDIHSDENDVALVTMCIETCFAQCTLFWAEMQLQQAEQEMREKDETT